MFLLLQTLIIMYIWHHGQPENYNNNNDDDSFSEKNYHKFLHNYRGENNFKMLIRLLDPAKYHLGFVLPVDR